MTLGVAFLSGTYACVVTDRRISNGSRVVLDEYNKSGVIDFADGRLAYTFTGVACVGNTFDMHMWFAEAACVAAGPDGQLHRSLEALREAVEHKLADLDLPPSQRRTSIVFVGYVWHESRSNGRPVLGFMSNFESLDGSRVLPEASSEVSLELEVLDDDYTIARSLGMTHTLTLEESELVRLAKKLVPPREIVKAAVRDIRAAGAKDSSANAIGDQCSSLVLAGDRNAVVSCGYHVRGISDTYFSPAYVHACYGSHGAWLTGAASAVGTPANRATTVLVTEVVRRNHPCPCGNGRKYKHCHGSAKAARLSEMRVRYPFKIIQEPKESVILSSFTTSDGQHPDGVQVGQIATSLNLMH